MAILVLCLASGTTFVSRSGSAGLSAAEAAQPHASHTTLRAIPLQIIERPIARRPGIGVAHEPVTTSVRDAQRWYDEGLAHLYSFAWLDAARAFNMALRADPKLAMAHLGLSFAYGGLGSRQGATDALERAQALASSAGPRDRIRIDLRGRQLRALADASAGADYAAALDAALRTSPEDVELLLLRGEAASATGGATGTATDGAAVPFFQRAQKVSPMAFGPRHYLAHAYENSGQVDLALQESQAYVRMAPAVPHAHHMAAHSLRRVGRIQEAIAEFEQAQALANATFKTDPVPPEYDWHTLHNASLLAGAYRYVGRLKTADGVLREAFGVSAPLLAEELGKRDWPALLLARGALADALTAAMQLVRHTDPIVRAAGHLLAAHVHMAAGRLPDAGREADAALTDLRAGGPLASELAPALRMAQGEFLLRSGDRERGRAMIRQAVASLRAEPGPDAWGQTLFALEAATTAARQAGDSALAAQLAEEMRLHDPNYAGTSFALALAAESRGDRLAARRAFEQAVARWVNADADHPDLVTAKTRLADRAPTTTPSSQR